MVTYTDEIQGPRSEDVWATVGDFVLRRADGAWAYQLAVVADDEAMGITDIVRGQDLEQSTARQILLRRALGHGVPRHAHVPLLLGPDGSKRSKRDGMAEVAELRSSGIEPQEVVARLAGSVGLLAPGVARIDPADLVADFSWDPVKSHPHRSFVWGG